MVSFNVTSQYANIPIIDALTQSRIILIIMINLLGKSLYLKTDFLMQLILVNLLLINTLYTFNSQFYQQTDGIAMGGPTSSTTVEVSMRAHEQTTITYMVYRKPTHTDQYLHYTSYHQTSCQESVISSLFGRTYFIIANKDDIAKENARIRQVLKENEYQESIINKIFKRIYNNHNLPQSQQ